MLRNEQIEQIRDILENKCNFTRQNDGTYLEQIYTDYRDKFPFDTIKKALSSDDPMQTLSEAVWDWETNYKYECGIDYYKEEILDQITDIDEDELYEWLSENLYFYYDIKDLSRTIKAYIMVDAGDMNYDFSCHNCMNQWDDSNELDPKSGLYWLAKQQKKLTMLKREIDRYNKATGEYVLPDDKFVASCINELSEQYNCMSALIFLVEMDLLDYIKLISAIRSEREKYNSSYYPGERTGTGYLVLDKRVECGLFNTWLGGGSMLGIECNTDVVLPFRYIDDICVEGMRERGYDVDEVYGLSSQCWKDVIKEIHPMQEFEQTA